MIGYKYRANAIEGKDSTRDIESLLNDEIWASSFRNLNDPFEATYTDEISKVLPIFNQVFNVNISDIQKNWKELMAFRDKLGIYSLSTSDKDFPDNELMWAHYANSHKGFCIAYDVEKLEDSEKFSLDVNRMTINYSEKPPQIEITDIKSPNFIIKLFGTKSPVWQYEKEIRLLYTNYGMKKYNPFALKAIYFGLNMDKQYQAQIIEKLENRDVKFYKMERKDKSYNLVPTLICENQRKIENKLSSDQYEILKIEHNHTVENFHVLYKGIKKDKESLIIFSSKFREQYATKPSNINIYDSKACIDLIGKNPLYGKEKTLFANHLIALSMFDTPDDIWLYPDKY